MPINRNYQLMAPQAISLSLATLKNEPSFPFPQNMYHPIFSDAV